MAKGSWFEVSNESDALKCSESEVDACSNRQIARKTSSKDDFTVIWKDQMWLWRGEPQKVPQRLYPSRSSVMVETKKVGVTLWHTRHSTGTADQYLQ
jgi:hypothetical protein